MVHSTRTVLLFVLMLITSTLTSETTCSTCCQCSDDLLPEVLPEVGNKVLVGSHYVGLTTYSLARCGVRCMRQRKCRSFNYDAGSKTCYLNEQSHLTLPGNMFIRPTDALSYYVVGQFDQSLLGGCSNHACVEDEICVERVGQTVPTYVCRPSYSADVPCWQSSCAECQPDREYNQSRFQPLGCYPSGTTRALPNFLGNFRVGTIVWDDLRSFERVLQQCAAASVNYELFGIEYYGECYAGNYSDVTFPNDVNVSECWSKCLYGGVGVGHSDVMFVYRWSP